MTHTNRLPLLAIIILLAAANSSAQAPTGTPPFGSYGGGPDIINLADLNSHVVAPVIHKAGRSGFNFTYDLSYDSSVWFPVGASGSQSWQPVWNWGWRGQTEITSGYVDYKISNHNCNIGTRQDPLIVTSTIYSFKYYHDQFGALHSILTTVAADDPQCPTGYPASAT